MPGIHKFDDGGTMMPYPRSCGCQQGDFVLANRRRPIDVADVVLLCDELSTTPGAGGIASYTLDLGRCLVAAGKTVVVIGINPDAWRTRLTESQGVTIVLGPGRAATAATLSFRRLPRSRRRLASTLALMAGLRSVRRAVVVEATDWMATGLAMPRGSIRVVQRHGSLSEMAAAAGDPPSFDLRFAIWLEQRGVSRAHLVTRWPSPSGVADRAEPTTLPPLDLRDWPIAPWSEAIPGRLVSVGRLERRKGPDVLLAAAGLLSSASVEWVGAAEATESAGLKARLGALATHLQRDFLLTAPMPRPELWRAYARAEVVVVSSRKEPLSLVALEACASGRPVILPEGSGAAILLEGLPAARTFSPGDPRSLAEAIRELQAPGDLRGLGQEAANWVREHLSVERVGAARIAIYEQAASKR